MKRQLLLTVNVIGLVVTLTILTGLNWSQPDTPLGGSRNRLQTLAPNDTCDGMGSSLQVARQYPVGASPLAVSVGDFNRDGLSDLVTADFIRGNANISILLGNGRGAFVTAASIEFSGSPSGIAISDFNRDGKQDLAIAGAYVSDNRDGVGILLGNGDGSFNTADRYATGIRVTSIVAADFNRDDRPDLAVTNSSSNTVSVLLGRGDGTFNQASHYEAPSSPIGVVAADFNSDGRLDLAATGPQGGAITILLSNGQGDFTAAPSIYLVTGCYSITAADFNSDGRPDLAVGVNGGIAILSGNGAGGFSEPVETRTKPAGSISVNDFNQDGKADLAYVNPNGYIDGMTVLLGNGAGRFSMVAEYGAGRPAYAIAASDFNRDGNPDAAVVNRDSVSILLGNGDGTFQAAVIVQVGIAPVAVDAGDFNKDGRMDIAITNSAIGISVAFGNAAGGFSAQRRYSIIGTSTAAVTGDFNRDGYTDLAVAGSDLPLTVGRVTILFGGMNDLGFGGEYSTGARPAYIVTADFNRDGNPDLATANSGSNDVSILIGNGSGGFGAARNFPVGLEPASLAAGDFNSDGAPDLAVANRSAATLTLLFGNGGGGFTPTTLGLDANPRAVVTGDFNVDGKPDLIVSRINTSLVSLLSGQGNGSFSAPINTDVGRIPFDMETADFNSDGKPDLAFTKLFNHQGFKYDRVMVLPGDGAGGFRTGIEYIVPLASFLTAADFNADGLPDLAIATEGWSGTARVWLALNVCAAGPTTVVTNVSAASYRGFILAGEAIVAAFGSGLSSETLSATTLPLPTQLAGVRVEVRDITGAARFAPLFFVSPSQVNYQMPAGLFPGPITITVASADGAISTGTAEVVTVAPGLFSANANGQGVAAAVALRVKADGTQQYESVARFDAATNRFVPVPIDLSPASDQVFLILFGTGFRFNSGLSAARVSVGGVNSEVLFAGATPGFVGLDQANVRLPRSLIGRGEVEIRLTADSQQANAVTISVK
jgi:uncharacterized protein (TIGR03437 family)